MTKPTPPPLKLPKHLANGIPRLPVRKFTIRNNGGHCYVVHPWYHDFEERQMVLKPGWAVVGFCDSLPEHLRFNREDHVAIMFQDPDGFDVWFHVLARYEIEDEIPLKFVTK